MRNDEFRKWLGGLIVRKLWIGMLLLCLLPVFALAQEPGGIPAQVQTMIDEYYGQRVPAEYAEITLSDGRREGIAVIEGRSVLGFECRDGVWEMTLQTFLTDELVPAYPEGVPGDPLAICLTREDRAGCMTWRFDGLEFRLAAWALPGNLPVTVDGENLIYGDGDGAFETVLPGGVTDWPWSADDLPLSPADALARAAIAEKSVQDMFPDYILRGYASYNDGTRADAVYSRIEDGTLYLRRVGLTAGYDPIVVDCMPVRLSNSLLARLEAEPFDDLICGWITDESFLTQDAFDLAAYSLPEGAVIRQNRIEKDCLIVLAEADGGTRLYVYEEGEDSVRVTNPLPEDVYLDFFHTGDGDVQFEWAAQNMSASFTRRADGQWLLSWCTCWGPSMDIHFSTHAFGIHTFDAETGEESCRIGTLAGNADLFNVNLSELTGAAPKLDQSGWAVVSNPNPADRLHLRTKASRSSRSLGKFYNGTPVRVLQEGREWTKVQIGLGDTAVTGWMMTRFLAFGADMDRVASAFPDLVYREEYWYHDEMYMYGAYWVAGVVEDDEYILLSYDGEVTYVPQRWLFEGYG